jgi:hypothetical protein
MSDETKPDLTAFLAKFSAPVLGFISLVSSIYGFVKLFAEKDAGLFTLVSLIVGILLLLGICLYYARFWQPESQDKSHSAFAPSLSNEQVKTQKQKEKQRKTVRRSAIAGLILIPILTAASFGG